MICSKCMKKPAARGIKYIECFKCGKRAIVRVDYNQICSECSEKLEICQYCGGKI